MAAWDGPWSHNAHYYPLILDAARPGCRRALDVGCGDGTLARALRRRVPSVTGIDVDGPCIAWASRQGDGVEYVLGDFLTHEFEPSSFDLVTSVAALHHMDLDATLERMALLLRPGGVLAVVGLARLRSPADLAFAAAGTVATRWHHLTKRDRLRRQRRDRPPGKPDAPIVWPPPATYADVRRAAERLLPGSRFRRHVLWRYSLIWTKQQ
jgi:SAM-dependent methyltransferase